MSNCIFKSLQHRILYGYKIYYIKPHKKDGLPHFCWYNSKELCYYHYTFKCSKPHWWKLLWFNGYIDKFPYHKLKNKLKLIKII